MTVLLLLVLISFGLLVASIVGWVPIWVPVLFVHIILLLQAVGAPLAHRIAG